MRTPPRACILQFAADDGPEHLGEHLSMRGVAWDVVRLSGPHDTVMLDDYDLLFALGGAMGVNDAPDYPFLAEARDLVGEAVRRELPYLGICLGSQILAWAMGTGVRVMESPEIGVVDVTLHHASGDPLLVGIPSPMKVLHYHQDTFLPPPGSRLLASSELCSAQILRCGPTTYGVQFHPEVALETFGQWLAADYAATTGITDPAVPANVLAEAASCQPEIRAHAARLFDNFLRIAGMEIEG